MCVNIKKYVDGSLYIQNYPRRYEQREEHSSTSAIVYVAAADATEEESDARAAGIVLTRASHLRSKGANCRCNWIYVA